LNTFGAQFGQLQGGELACADGPTATLKIFDANAKGTEQELTLVPDCGGVGIPEGAHEVKKVSLVYGDWSITDPDTGLTSRSEDAPWFRLISKSGFGGGVMFDLKTGELVVLMGVRDDRGSTTIIQDLSIATELTIDRLAKLSLGRDLSNLGNLQKWYDRGVPWSMDLVISQ
jgi:hypothetical protein